MTTAISEIEGKLQADLFKSGGPDNLQFRIMKESAHGIASLIARIFNESVKSGMVLYD